MSYKKEYISDYSIWALSLVKLTGKSIADITGRVVTEFSEPVFKLSEVVFSDGSKMSCEGEHDLPYLVTYPGQEQPNINEKSLMAIYDRDNDDNEFSED
jgi:hypothetical protein